MAGGLSYAWGRRGGGGIPLIALGDGDSSGRSFLVRESRCEMCTGRLRREEVEGVDDDADVRDVLEAVREAVGVEMTDSGQSFHPGMEAGAFWKDCSLSDIALVCCRCPMRACNMGTRREHVSRCHVEVVSGEVRCEGQLMKKLFLPSSSRRRRRRRRGKGNSRVVHGTAR